MQGPMRSLLPYVASLLLIGSVGCSDDPRDRRGVDSGVSRIDSGRPSQDGGSISFDTGPRTDSGVTSDAGTADGGGPACDEPITSLVTFNMSDPELAGMVLPRCGAGAIPCVQACPAMDNDCVQRCLDADPTPALTGTEIDCAFCIDTQIAHCVDRNCPTEYAALRCCRETNGCMGTAPCPACETQSTALNTCAERDFSCADDTTPCFP